MWECRHCGEFVRGQRDKLPARCPHCREPLFEKAGGPVLTDEQYPDRGICSLHPHNVAIGTCRRCGNFFCPVCRTRWHERILCVSCVERFLAGEEKQSEEQKAHSRQAILACVCGLGAWILLVLAVAAIIPAVASPTAIGLLVLALLLVISSFLAALLGLGQAVTAIRTRGQRMFAATSGLVLSGSYLGVCLGILLLSILRR